MPGEMPPELKAVLATRDYQTLQTMVNKHLASIAGASPDEIQEFYEKTIGHHIDVKALTFFGVTRASTVASNNATLMELLASMWLEGFLVGALFEPTSGD